MRFQSKLIVSTLVLILGGQAIFFAYFSRLLRSLAAERLEEKAIALAQNLSWTGAHGVYDDNLYRTLDPLIDGLHRDPEVHASSIRDKSGALLAGFGAESEGGGVVLPNNPVVRRVSVRGVWHVEAVVPVFSPVRRSTAIGSVRVELASLSLKRRLWEAALTSLLLALMLAALGVSAIFLVTGRLLAPINLILAADEAAKRGDIHGESIPESAIPRDEIGLIIRSRAAMLTALRAAQESSEMLAKGERRRAEELEKVLGDLKIAREQLTHAERVSLIGGLVAGVAHEINNPMTGIIGYAEMLMNDPGVPLQARRDAESILQQALRCKAIVKDLSAFARKQAPAKAPVDLNALILECLKLDSHQLRVGGVHVESDLDGALPAVHVDRQQMSQVLLNLIINARQAMLSRPEGRMLAVRTRTVGGQARVEVEDNGPGVASENLKHVFEPFFTTKPVGEGTGLGLSVSQGIIASHGGRIWAENRPEGGARFIVELPLADALNVPVAAGGGSAPVLRGFADGMRIIVVEDDTAVRRILCRMLESLGATIESFSDGIRAKDRLKAGGFEWVFCDVRMPKMTGLELYGECRDGLGGARWVFVTGSIGVETLQGLEESGCAVLRKPFTKDELEKILRAGPVA